MEKSIGIAEALVSLIGLYGWNTVDDEVFYADDQLVRPTAEELAAEMAILQSDYSAIKYQRDRKVEYDKLNQDEMRFDDLMNDTTTWTDAILAIKAMYPK